MKRIRIWSIILIAVMSLPMMVACSSDDDNNGDSNDGTAIAYTEDEVLAILKGEWDVYGSVDLTFDNDSIHRQEYEDYNGYLRFYPDHFNFKITDSNKDKDYNLGYMIIDTSGIYKLKKKNGRYFIHFDEQRYEFEIISLTKSSFKMLMDTEIENYYNLGIKMQAHMTIYSK